MLLSFFRNLQQLEEEIYQEGVAMRQAINKDNNNATEEETTKNQKCKEKKKVWNWCHEHIVKLILD